MSKFHCCATCKNYEVVKSKNHDTYYRCVRLGFETKPNYQFNCWDPKDNVKKLMSSNRIDEE